MNTAMLIRMTVLLSLLPVTAAQANAAAVLKAKYEFNGNLASSVEGAGTLSAIDPTSTNGFAYVADGESTRTVYQARGTLNSGQQGGLQFDSSGLVSGSAYSLSLSFSQLPTTSNWIRLVDTLDGTSDSGLYLDPSRSPMVFGATIGDYFAAKVNESTFYNLALTVDSGYIKTYLDGNLVQSTYNSALNLSPSGIVTLFRDNITGGVTTEWAPMDIDTFSFYDGALTGEEVRSLHTSGAVAAVPEPATWAMMLVGFGMVGGAARYRRRNTAKVYA